MQPTEAATPQELAQLHRETRIENRAYARAQERAAVDPCKEYRCECGNTATALEIAWWGTECSCGQWRMTGVQLAPTNPVTGAHPVVLQAGPL